MPYKSITVQQNFHKMRSGVERCFMELFAVCIHINNVDPQKLVQVGKRANTVRPYSGYYTKFMWSICANK